MFQQPSQGDRFNANELLGSLCLFYVHEVRTGINTTFGEKEAIACDVHVLDGPHGGEVLENALIFQGALIGSLRGAAGGDPVLARIGNGVAKPGQKPPFILSEFTDADAKLASDYIAKRFQGAGNGGGTTAPKAGNGNSQPAAATASPAASSASGNRTTVDVSSLPPEVQELLRQTGAVPS